MFYKRIQPIRDRLKYSDDLEKIINTELFYLIYKPLIDLLDSTMKENAKPSVLINAFLSRIIYFNDGYVYGKFNASISKALINLGGTFNQSKKAFKISLSQLPPETRDALARGSAAEQEAIDRMQAKIQELAAQAVVIPGAEDISKNTLADLHKQFEKLTPEDLQIPVEMNEQQEEQVRKEYTESIHLNINNLSKEMTERLRYRVEQAVGQGMRAEKLKEVLTAEYGIAANRAKFIARQDTSLFVAKYREVRYEDAGLPEYQWSTSNDTHVRQDHKDLNGRIFRWDDPPITDKATGARNNPGEDYGCRCLAIPCVLVAGQESNRPLVKFEIEGGNVLETSEHKKLHG